MLINNIINGSLVFQHIIENMHGGVLTIDSLGIITTVNPAAEAILNKRMEELLDKNSHTFIAAKKHLQAIITEQSTVIPT